MQLCNHCGKRVRDKPILGTIHVCLTDEEIRVKNYRIQQAQHQIEMQKQLTTGREIQARADVYFPVFTRDTSNDEFWQQVRNSLRL
jgi:hypothetical protein